MIKSLFEITSKDVILLEETQSASHLKRFRWIPFFVVKDKLNKLVREINDRLGDKKTRDGLQEEYEKTLAYQKLQLLDAFYYGLIAEFGIKTRFNAFKILMGEKPKEYESFIHLIELVKEHTGIDVLDEGGFKKFEAHRIFKQDKFNERYPEKKEDEKKKSPTFAKIFVSYMRHSNSGIKETDRFLLFIELKQSIDEDSRKAALKDNG